MQQFNLNDYLRLCSEPTERRQNNESGESSSGGIHNMVILNELFKFPFLKRLSTWRKKVNAQNQSPWRHASRVHNPQRKCYGHLLPKERRYLQRRPYAT